MNRKLITGLFVLGLWASHSSITDAAVITFSAAAPAVGVNDIANLTASANDGGNVNNGSDSATYLASDRPAMGQTFTTGSHPGGYVLTAITLQHAPYYPTWWKTTAGGQFNLRITLPSGGTLTILDTESATTVADPNNFGSGSGAGGTGKFITFTLASPVALLPDTVYGFDIAGTSSGYFEAAGTNTNPYTGGLAYSSGSSGAGNTTLATNTGDHVFIVSLAAVPEPAALVLLALAGLIALPHRRRA